MQTQKTLFKIPRIKHLNNALLIDSKILVLADLHLGLEDYLIKKGLAPRTQLHEIITNLDQILTKLKKQNIKLEKIIILGDLKHEHGKISETEWRETLYFLDVISKKAKEIILIKGNHDNILKPITNKRNLQIKPYYKYKDILFMHGHKEYKIPMKNKFKILILAHLHPSITLTDNYKREKFKCFLQGKYKSKQVYILPSFNPLSSGYDLTKDQYIKRKNYEFLIIPETKLKNFNILIHNQKENQTLDFGKLKDFV